MLPELSIITVADKLGRAYILQYIILKLKRVTQIIFALELFAAVSSYDTAGTVSRTVKNIFDGIIPLVFYTDSSFWSENIVFSAQQWRPPF